MVGIEFEKDEIVYRDIETVEKFFMTILERTRDAI